VLLEEAFDSQMCILIQNQEKVMLKSFNINGRYLCKAGSVILRCILKKKLAASSMLHEAKIAYYAFDVIRY